MGDCDRLTVVRTTPSLSITRSTNGTVVTRSPTQTTVSAPQQALRVVVPGDTSAVTLSPQTARVVNLVTPGRQGPPGLSGETVPPIYFSYGDASGPVFTAPSNGLLSYSRISIDTAFDGTASSISVGSMPGGSDVQSPAYSDPATVGDYENTPDVTLTSGQHVYLTITLGTGVTQGAGFVLLNFVET